ncbi:MAG: hypothetical protein E7463_08905 [Ruminococcaceae bacterium]|nr:hypothetical protein [Oscillospiraceae bacterium]
MSERTERLRVHARDVNGAYTSDERVYLFLQGMEKNPVQNEIYRRGLAKRWQLSRETPVIDADELIVGKPCQRKLTGAEQAEFDRLLKAEKMMARRSGQESHMAVDYEKLLRLGTTGIRAEIEGYKAKLDDANPADQEKLFFYDACLESLLGLEAYSWHYSCLASALADTEKDPVRAAELKKIAEITAKVPKYPAGSFYEACQSISFLTAAMEGQYQLGRPDRYLWPYYQADRDAGILTRDEALELCTCLGIMYSEHCNKGLAEGFMVCGRDENGKDVTNELSYIFIETIALVRLSYPGVGVCINSDTPEDIIELSCRMLGKGYSHPAIFNDDLIIKGLVGYGVPYEHACTYIHCTCVEITPIKRSACWVASPYHNLTNYLLELMAEPNADEKYPTFEALLAGYHELLASHIRRGVVDQNRAMTNRMHSYANPLVSCFVDDCLAEGRDIEQGGAAYNWIMPSFVGMANLVDSLVALEELVYKGQEYSLSALRQIMRDNYAGNEALRRRIDQSFEKYGNDCERPDGLVSVINGFILEEVAKYENPRGGRFIPSLFCWVMHERFGRATEATPDGRPAGFPLGDGSGPAQGRDRTGPTSAIMSTTKWDHSPFIGGIALNLRFSATMFEESLIPKMCALVHTYIDRGGFEMQVNVVDREAMKQAQICPEQYRDLVVRIGGYSDFFTRLDVNMQNELIQRSEHTL